MVAKHQLATVATPEAWELPPGIEVRRGLVDGFELISFFNTRTKVGTGVSASVLNEAAPLPAWLAERIKLVAEGRKLLWS